MSNPCKGTSPLRDPVSIWRAILCAINSLVQTVKTGFHIPLHDDVVIAYVGSTNNISTVTYKLNGATVATLTFTYAASGAADDDLVVRIQKS